MHSIRRKCTDMYPSGAASYGTAMHCALEKQFEDGHKLSDSNIQKVMHCTLIA